MTSKTILFVTGAFVSNACWDEWKGYFESKGYTVIAPAWPNKDASAAELRRRHPDHAVASNRLTDLIEHYAMIAKNMPEKPIVIGHSLGGLIAQILASRGISAASVAIHSAPPYGIMPTGISFLISGWKPLGFFTPINDTFLMSFSWWQFAFANGQPLEEQKSSFEKIAIPESKRIVRDGITRAAWVDFAAPHSPLLFIAGSTDHFFKPSVNLKNARKYTDKNSLSDFKSFEGRNHGVLLLPTWREEADYILDWIQKL